MSLKRRIERNAQKLLGFTFLFLGVYDGEGKPLFLVKKNSFQENVEEKAPYIIFGVKQLLKITGKCKEDIEAIILEKDGFFYVVVRGNYRGEELYVLYAVEKGWFIFSSVEKAIKKAKSFIRELERGQ